MIRMLRAAMVVARRDFSAVILSKSFILFLIGPMLPVLFGVAAGGVGTRLFATDATPPMIALTLPADEASALIAARTRLAKDLGEGSLPRLHAGETREATAYLSGDLTRPMLTGKQGDLKAMAGPLQLMIATAGAEARLPDATLTLKPVAETVNTLEKGRLILGQGTQVLLFFLTMMLAGMVLSNLVEEKTNKIMEILAAAIPIDAVFVGKLLAMLAMSLVGIACWSGIAALFLGADGGGALALLPTPAVGWPAFVALAIAYFATAYTLLGALFIGIGAQASTVRQVQTLSMPVTMGQVGVFFLASYAVDRMGSAAEWAAVLFPLSSPFAMIARAAQVPGVGQHLVALIWQLLWIAIIVRGGVLLFRRNVLKSGGGLFRRRSVTAE